MAERPGHPARPRLNAPSAELRTPPALRTSSARLSTLACTAAAALLVVPSCATEQVETQGASRTSASYTLPKLSTSLPEWVTPRAVAAAAEQTLRDRGYAVTSSTATTDRIKVVARAPNTGPLKRYVVKGEWTRNGSSVSVKCDPLGDEVRSRAILDGILARLGL